MPILVLMVALTVLGATIGLGTDWLRRGVRAQMVNHDGEILHAVALAQQFSRGAPTELNQRLQSPAEQLALALELSQLRDNVVAVRLYDPAGKLVTAIPLYIAEATLDGPALAELRKLQPVSRYLGTVPLSDLLLAEDPAAEATNVASLLEVNIPIHTRDEPQLLGTAQLVLEAGNLEREFARLDRRLWGQAALAFLAGGGLLVAALLWAYRRLARSHALLAERTERLLHANHELALAAKTGALGAVTAHLVHGLCNPLANVRDFVASHGAGAAADPDWQDALAATRRMEGLVREVVRVLGEENGTDQYEITLAELAGILSAKLRPATEQAGVPCEVRLSAAGQLANRHANLVLLILENLVQNALQVTPRGRRVNVTLSGGDGAVVCEVRDEGPGFPPHLLPDVFRPCRSTKGGSGLGLAISRQLAHHLGARLELRQTGATGSVLVLTLPRTLLTDAPPARTAVGQPPDSLLTPATKEALP